MSNKGGNVKEHLKEIEQKNKINEWNIIKTQ